MSEGREADASRPRPWVVAGVDGSSDSEEAALWAADYARTMGGRLELVCAHSGRVMYGMPPMQVAYDTEHGAQIAIDKAVAAIGVDPRDVTRSAVRGLAGRVLTDLSQDADLVVVGARGHGGVSRALLGSVSTHVVHHARCPVVVVPPKGDRPG